ncbi:MAG: hypothetical protein H6574_04965 [Lewinellaceae bacterium]|nr:hypothetical protein [Saprospiraceae bacterium]MCB9330414.1 hypothetical protein [Lewinellaceae bacterium]
MNKKLVYLFALLGIMVMFAPACGDTDPCKDVDCGANGTCFEGVCVCNVGYEGGDCNTEWSEKFLGDYTAESSCNAGSTYQGTITRISESEIRINEYGGFSGANHIDVSVSLASASDVSATGIVVNVTNDGYNRKITGTGSISGKVITITATIDYNDGFPPETCTDVLTLD